MPSVVDVLGQKATRDGRNVRGIGQENGEDPHRATPFVEKKAVGNYASPEGEEGAGSNSIQYLFADEQASQNKAER